MTRDASIAAAHDLSCHGKAALTIVIPILSAMGFQVSPLPTALLSTHTGIPGARILRLTDFLRQTVDHWSALGLHFDGFYSGYLGTPEQVDVLLPLAKRIRDDGGLVVVDPVLGDGGRLYAGIGAEMVTAMRALLRVANVAVPNLTEAAVLLGEEPSALTRLPPKAVGQHLARLADIGPDQIVLTSAPCDDASSVAVLVHDRQQRRTIEIRGDRVGDGRWGTGDAFASVLVGAILRGSSIEESARQAMRFVASALRHNEAAPATDGQGLMIERVLSGPW